MQTPEIIMLTPVSTTKPTTKTTTATSGSKTTLTKVLKLTPSSVWFYRNMFHLQQMSPSMVTAKNLAIKPKSFKNLSVFWLWPLLILCTLRVTYSQGK